MRKISQFNLIILFIAFIIIVPTMTVIYRNIDISEIENRTLESTPSFDKNSFLSGAYFREWEDYISDHIWKRDLWIKYYTKFNMSLLGKNNINNIVIGESGTLLPFFSKELNENLETYLTNIPLMTDNLKELNSHINENGGRFCFVGVPGQASFLNEKYPNHIENNSEYFVANERIMFEQLEEKNVDFINMNEVFRNSDETNFYLKTDHHYNFDGAYKTYSEIIKKLIEDFKFEIRPPLTMNDLDIITLPNDILGSRNRQLYFLYPTDEKVKIAYPKEEIYYEKYTNGNADPDFYHLNEDPNERPTYGVYMGGDFAEIVIKTNREDLPNILLFGDSFTNAVEPLLYYHFNETRILDLRYYKEMSLYEYIEEFKPDIVVMIRDDLNYGNLDGNGKFKR